VTAQIKEKTMGGGTHNIVYERGGDTTPHRYVESIIANPPPRGE